MNIKKLLSFIILGAIIICTSWAEPKEIRHPGEHPRYSAPFSLKHSAPAQNHSGTLVKSSFLPKDGDKLYDYYFREYSNPGNLKQLKTVWKKAQYFTEFIDMKIQEHNMPAEILYLPLVESVYDTNAVSKSGATGLWQFMPNSIDEYNMEFSEWLDERKDFWKSTEGAIAKLQYNYSQLGDWLLAIAAYNCGLGTMKRAVRQAKTNDYWQLCQMGYIHKETMNYIPKLLAVSDIMINRDKYGITDTVNTNMDWQRIKPLHCTDIRILAKECNIPQEIMFLGNAELNYYVTPPMKNSEYMLKIPAKYVQTVENVLAKSPNLTDFKFHKIQNGDTLSHLSKYYDVSISMLETFNNVNPNNLKIGSKLIIPIMKKNTASNESPKIHTREWKPTENKDKFCHEYTVKEQDSLWSIAMEFGTDVNHLAYYNNISEDSILSIGKKLMVPEK